MSAVVDITGQTFGHLTVIGRAGTDRTRKKATWRCRCSCGGETVADGVALRKGDRRSCGCRSRTTSTKTQQEGSVNKTDATRSASAEAARWTPAEVEGSTILVGNGMTTVLVDWNEQTRGWECSHCGPQDVGSNPASLACPHVMAAGRHLPLEVALALVAQVSRERITKLSKPTRGGKNGDDAAAEKALAESLERGAPKRAERVRAHDAEFVAASPVVVRQATPEDLERLRLARQRKAKQYKPLLSSAR